MASYPNPSPTASAIRGSVFSSLAHRLESHPGEVYPLHVGDTWLEPVNGARLEDLRVAAHPGLHRYAPPGGLPSLVDALVERLRRRHPGLFVERRNVMVTAGATAGLFAVMGATLDPGDEVLVLAPYWPLIEGIVRVARGAPVIVPVDGLSSATDLVDALSEVCGDRAAAVYVNSPNNPTGRVLPAPWIEALVEWARSRDLWIVTDEIYEDYVYEGEARSSLPLAPERTFAAFSFSKAYGMAGNRCGYIVGPPAIMAELQKVATHTFYSTPTASQLAALRVLGAEGDAWLRTARERYVELGRKTAGLLELPVPEGGTFLFFDVAPVLDQRGLLGLLEDCAEEGVFLAPGPSFGPYPTHVRLCFTAAPPEVTMRGVESLRRILADRRRA
jgi:N-succinyldiaminopimelate aminotransferase